ncbi:MAG: class I SAM-dependent methyltransferase [Actinobacteria bacterium HGW-Actinobacteria-2]|nr:MAG: class I SAM-dependent methyltransferase [Actinobacteria bacterium HGW-Actinobacteria-2]
MTDSATWNERYAATELVWSSEPNQFVVETCAGLRPGRALDLGAGEGRNAVWLAGRGWTVTAVDFAENAVSRITARSAMEALKITATVADAVSYQPPAGSLELALLCYLQLPLAQLRKAITHVAAGLVAGGRLVVIAHDASNLQHGYGGPRDPNMLTTATQVAQAMTEAGLQVDSADVRERQVLVDTGFRYALDHVVIGSR